MQFPPAVEQWRSLVAQHFPANLVDKALWVIQHESGGNPGAVGDGGAARGLFQIQDSSNFSSRPDAAFLDDPANNIAYAANQLGAASGNFAAWGENNLYQGKPFGALGNHPFPGSSGDRASTAGGTTFTGIGQTTNQQKEKMSADDIRRLTGSEGAERYVDPEVTKPRPAGTTVTNRSGRGQTSGTPQEQMQQLMGYAEESWNALDDYLVGSSQGLIPDPGRGIVLYIDEFGEEQIDQEGTKLLRSALSYQDQMQRLLDYRDAGIISLGDDNAGAAFNSAQAEASEAERAYNDYTTRIGDIFAIEKAEGDRADQIRQAAMDSQDAHIKQKAAAREGIAVGDIGFRFPGQEKGAGYRDAIRSTVPDQAPSFRSVPTSAIQSAFPQGGTNTAGYKDPPVPEQTPSQRIPLGPAGFTPEDYIQKYLIPGLKPAGSLGVRMGFEP